MNGFNSSIKGVARLETTYAVILAAGQGTRMKSSKYKVLHEIAGKSMVEHVLGQVEELHPETIVTVVGCGADSVKQLLGSRSDYAFQSEQLGTAHAVSMAAPFLENKTGVTLVVCGDTPLLTSDTLSELLEQHHLSRAKVTVLTAVLDDATGYGRIIRDSNGNIEKIVEQKDATEEERQVKEMNTGTYCFDNEFLFSNLSHVTNDNAQAEYYLPDMISIALENGLIASASVMQDANESIGVNDRVALAEATRLMRERINAKHMKNGVTFFDPSSTYIDIDVMIDSDTTIESGVQLKGSTTIGKNCYIGAHSEIVDSTLEDDITVKSSFIEQSVLHTNCDIGPYAHLRPASEIGSRVHIGNFVEIKKATIDEDTKIGHLTYVGDASVGKDVNIGCGTIFVNFDGKSKHRVDVGDNSFIGCNANLVAPVSIGKNSFVAAGSTVTKNVPDESLAIARTQQINKEGYARKLPPLSE